MLTVNISCLSSVKVDLFISSKIIFWPNYAMMLLTRKSLMKHSLAHKHLVSRVGLSVTVSRTSIDLLIHVYLACFCMAKTLCGLWLLATSTCPLASCSCHTWKIVGRSLEKKYDEEGSILNYKNSSTPPSIKINIANDVSTRDEKLFSSVSQEKHVFGKNFSMVITRDSDKMGLNANLNS